MNSIEQFERDVEAKRARLLKDLALAKAALPAPVTVTWVGENGWDNVGKPNPPIEKSVDVAPWIIHSPFRGAEHIAFKAPDSCAGAHGEHVTSEYREGFVRKYFLAVLDAFEPYIMDTVAIKGTYSSYVPESFDWAASRDYKDARILARGLFEVTTTIGEGYRSAELAFYVRHPTAGPCKISFDLGRSSFERYPFKTDHLTPRPIYQGRRHGDDTRVPACWDFPELRDVGAAHLSYRGNTERNSHGVPSGYTLEWLFASRESLLAAILPEPEKK